MNHYELLYILPISCPEENIPSVMQSIQKIIAETGGKLTLEESFGKKKLAYPIKTQRHGTYISCEFDVESSSLSDMDRRLRLNTDILRFLLTEKELKTAAHLKTEQLAKERFAKRIRLVREQAAAATAETQTGEKAKDLLKAHAQDDASKKEEAGKQETAKASGDETKSAADVSAVKKPSLTLEELDKKLDKILDDNML